MSFSGDGRYLITQTNAPDWLLTFWNWDKLKLIGSMPSMDASALPAGTVPAVYQVSFNRYDANFALVVGKNHFQCFRHDETGMRKATIPGLEQEVERSVFVRNVII